MRRIPLAPRAADSMSRTMNRQKLLTAACILAAVSLGLNAWLMWKRNHPEPAPPPAAKPVPTVQLPTSAEFDFSGTGLSDDAWKLSDKPKSGVKLDQEFKLTLKEEPSPK